jgi:competence protein ComGF
MIFTLDNVVVKDSSSEQRYERSELKIYMRLVREVKSWYIKLWQFNVEEMSKWQHG